MGPAAHGAVRLLFAASLVPGGVGGFPPGIGVCDLSSTTPAQCRAKIVAHCTGIWDQCDGTPSCERVHSCLDDHDVASMSAAKPCFPDRVEGLANVLAECLAHVLPEAQPPTCLGRSGHTVDWWFMYKLPSGLHYAYHDSAGDVVADPTSHAPSSNHSAGSLGGTIANIFAAKATGASNLAYVLYNDQPPDGVTPQHDLPEGDKGAHAKGMVATDGNVGFWLIHSIPKLPDLRQPQYFYSGSPKFGQTLLCLSLTKDTVEQVAAQLQTAHPIIYEANVPLKLQGSVPTVRELANGQFGHTDFSTATLRTRGVGGASPLQLTSFIKSPLWIANVYEQLVGPALQKQGVGSDGMVWETWRRNPYTLDSFCPPEFSLPSLNALNLSFPCNQQVAADPVKCDFHYTSDHAKWGMSKSGSKIVCVGGINRMSSQQHRGGGTVCFAHEALHAQLGSVIRAEQSCAVLPKGQPLKILAAKMNVRIGAQIVDQGDLPYSSEAAQPYHRLWVNQFNLFSWRSCSGWPALRPNATAAPEFACADRLTHYAQTQGVVAGNPTRMSALFLGPLVPADSVDNAEWVLNKVRQHPSADSLRALVLDHIDAVVGHFEATCNGSSTAFADYSGIDINGIVVAADGVAADGSLKPAGTAAGSQNVWASAWPVAKASDAAELSTTVPGWMTEPYEQARKQVPAGVPLLYADADLGEVGPKATAVLTLLKAARDADSMASPDGVLFRLGAHESANSDALAKAIVAFGAASFPVWLAVDAKVSGSSYGGVAEACVQAGDSCRAIVFAGFSDRYCPDGRDNSNCMLDANFVAKTSFAKLQTALSP